MVFTIFNLWCWGLEVFYWVQSVEGTQLKSEITGSSNPANPSQYLLPRTWRFPKQPSAQVGEEVFDWAWSGRHLPRHRKPLKLNMIDCPNHTKPAPQIENMHQILKTPTKYSKQGNDVMSSAYFLGFWTIVVFCIFERFAWIWWFLNKLIDPWLPPKLHFPITLGKFFNKGIGFRKYFDDKMRKWWWRFWRKTKLCDDGFEVKQNCVVMVLKW